LKRLRSLVYPTCLALLWPLNQLLAPLLARRFVPGSVLHISYMGHVPYDTVHILRDEGVRADYLAVGSSPIWDRSDYQMTSSRWPWITVLREFRLFWTVVARYEIVHAHFMVTLSRTGWELPLLKRMGRKLVVHFRGCEIRNRQLNMARHPRYNICEECDYRPYVCQAPHNVLRRQLAAAHGDVTLVTTPDLKEFVPQATHIKFFVPTQSNRPAREMPSKRTGPLRIVHATNHPGIEGTRHIVQAVDSLKAKGYDIELRVLSGVTQESVLAHMATADLTIGKMKMGYYANAQIESLVMGVPAITHVRAEYMTPELAESGLIFASIDTLEETLEYYLQHPEALAEKRVKARESVRRLHDNHAIAEEIKAIYQRVQSLDPVRPRRAVAV
jgi:hypothetical protein